MNKRSFFGSLLVLAAIFTFSVNFSSCSFDSGSSDSGKSSKSEALYGSLRIENKSSSRQLEVSAIEKADVSVTGYGISEEKAATLKKQNVSISGGKHLGGSGEVEAVVIEGIPVGANRVVTVEAKTTIDSVLHKMAGVTMTAVCDIASGENSVGVNWESTKVGNVYAELLKLDYNISNLPANIVESYLPKDGQGKIISSGLINASLLASEIKAGTASTSKDYSVQTGSLTFSSDVSSSEITILVCDPVSSALTSVSSGTNTITNVAPGTWMVFGIVNGTTVVYKDSVTIEAGETTVIPEGEIQFKAPKPRLENASGIQISEFITSATTVYLKARTLDGEEEPEGVKIYYTTNGDAPSTSSTLYNAENGISVTSGVTVKAIAVCSGLLNSEVSSWTFPALGFTHPESGMYSPVDMNGSASGFGWASGTWTLGATVSGEETTFALYSANATKILLEIYGSAYGTEAMYDYWMEKDANNVWRAKLSGDLTGAIYAFRCWGPNWPYDESWTRGGSNAGYIGDYDSYGNRFNPNKVVYDPYAREMTHDASNADAIAAYKTEKAAYKLTKPEYQILSSGQPIATSIKWREYDSGTIAPKGYVITDSTSYGVKPGIAQKDAIIYEAHVRGLTKHSSTANLSTLLSDYVDMEDIPAEYRGTYKGATYMIPYLKMLGINTIELLPVHETDNDANPDDGPGGNFWGYMTFDYFAPDRRYSSDKSVGGPTREFKEMVDAFHNEGIEVYLDVVYNHSGEGGNWNGNSEKWDPDQNKEVPNENYDEGKQCTIVSMRGIDNQTYYSLVKGTTWSYWDTTGCGNNLQCDNSVVRQLILDSLTYWIDEMGVDGFRFDLATVLGRERNATTGNWDYNSSATTLTQIASLGSSKKVEMIAESWDCGSNSYQVGNFPAGWGGWNGRYRDAMRKFVGYGSRTDSGYGNINSFINGDYDNFNKEGGPQKSVNFIVAHDGYTLADLCSGYTEAGDSYNNSLKWPFGPSGDGDKNPALNGFGTEAANKRQAVRNMFALQMISRGVPMIVYGDEFGRTQNGNNNPYPVDSVCTWNNYNMVATSSPHTVSTGYTQAYHNNFGTFGNTAGKNGNFEFARYMMNLHASEPAFRQDTYTVGYDFKKEDGTRTLSDDDRCVWIRIDGDTVTGGSDYLVFINMYTTEVGYTIPDADSGHHWVRLTDTANWAEENFNCWSESSAATVDTEYGVKAWSVVILKQVSNAPVTPTCAAPSIIGTDSFTTSSEITITSSEGAAIYYTTDGATPTTSSTLYEDPFVITSTTTVKAIAVKDGYNNSTVASKKFTKDAPTVTLSFSGDTTFTTSTTVTITATPSNAAIYYTLDGTPPTTSSTVYTGNITLTETKTVKAIGVLAGYETSEIISQRYTLKTVSSKSGVMLQGFNWDSAPREKSAYWGKWYNIMMDNATQIGKTFEYVWCPPPSKTNTDSSEGYGPTQWFNLNNCYGTKEELEEMIQAIKPAKALADVVVNHRDGTTSWGDFTLPDLGCSLSENYYPAICSDDEGFTNSQSPMYGHSSGCGAADTGAKYAASRDLDHTNTDVQNGIKQYLNDYLKPAGFVGWRYDFVKGFDGLYVGMYNAASDAEFAVGEYWPGTDDGGGYFSASDPTAWANKIDGWISRTEDGGYKTRAFDFVLKGMMNQIWGGSETANGNFGLLASSSTLVNSQPAYAVTFVDNHDTGSTQSHWYLASSAVPAAYAYILTHPGFPCVAWQHYFSYAESGSNLSAGGTQFISGNSAGTVNGSSGTLRELIDTLIDLRKSLGIEYDSSKEILSSSSSCYAARVDGLNGSFIVSIGSSTYSGDVSDYEVIASGTNYKVWATSSGTQKCKSPSISFSDGTCTITCATAGSEIMYKIGSGSYQSYSVPFAVSEGATVYAYATADGYDDSSEVSKTYVAGISVTVTVPDWTWNGSVAVFAWVWPSGGEGQWVSCTGSGTTVNFTMSTDCNNFLIVRCPPGTTQPDWDASGDAAGRIYNKTEDTSYTGSGTYTVSFTEYNPNS